jgi:hypothetical protein
VDRQFNLAAPNRLLVADFTYVKLATGAFCYVAFVIEPKPPQARKPGSSSRFSGPRCGAPLDSD